MNIDQLTICPKCGSDGCYKLPINEVAFSYYDFGCGFQTNDLMKEGEFNFEEYEETLPELYKDLRSVDSEKRVWYPISINIPSKGTVFINGTSKDNWQWAGIKAIELTEEEKKEPKYKEATHKSDAKSLKHFGTDFIEACDYIGVFENQ
jgi:hypothetical protein